jgi:hypothetical protein
MKAIYEKNMARRGLPAVECDMAKLEEIVKAVAELIPEGVEIEYISADEIN